MERDPSQDLPVVVVDISSDEGSPPIVVSNDDFDWLGELLYEDAVVVGLAEGEEEGDDDDDVIVKGEFGPLDKSRKRKLEGSDDTDSADDDECLVLDGDPDKFVAAVEGVKGNDDGSDSDDLLLVGEKGQVACRDYPHPRHDCIKFPFSTTGHEKHCNLCHCYVCDSLAPCIYWGTGMSNSDHCHATDKDGDWEISRKNLKLGKSAGQNALGIDNGNAQIVVPLPAQNLHDGRMPSAASSTPQNLVSQQMMAHQAGQTIIPGCPLIPTNRMPQNRLPRPAICHPPRKTLPAISFLERQPILQRCSSSVAYHSSDHINSGVRKRLSGNLKVGPQLHYAPGRLSHAINVVQHDGHRVRSNMRSQQASSAPRFNKMGIAYQPPASIAGHVSNNTGCSHQVQCGGKFPKYTAINACHNKIPRQNGLVCPDFPADMRSDRLNATGPLPNMVHPQSSGFCHPCSGMSTDARFVSPIYQQIEDTWPLNQSDHAHHQNQVVPPHHEVETMDSAPVTEGHRPPIQQSNLHLHQVFDLGSETMNNNWWSENELLQGQILLEHPAAALDMGMLLSDLQTPWNGVTRS